MTATLITPLRRAPYVKPAMRRVWTIDRARRRQRVRRFWRYVARRARVRCATWAVAARRDDR